MMNETLKKAQQKQDDLNNEICGSPDILMQRPLFHFATPGGWCNDPNGFSQFDNKVHLFYQYHPYSTQWGPMHWGHVTSKDMLNWELQPVALAPDTNADCNGCFSGTAIDDNGKHIIAYTGVSSNGNVDIQKQCIAIGDGVIYEKLAENPLITAENIPFEYNNEHFRDPKLWKKDNLYFMLCVIKQNNNRGALVLFESEDCRNWRYKGMPDYSKDGLSNMWECPDFNIIDGKDVLILSPQEVLENEETGFHNGNNSIYITGKMDYENCRFIRETRPENGYTAALIDYGIDFYAPETTKLKDGRTILIGWMQAWESYITPADYIWSGMMTLPREISIKNNRLYQKPVRELENWKCNKISGYIDMKSREKILSDSLRHFEVDIQLDGNEADSAKFILEGDEEQISLEINLSERTIIFDRSKSRFPGAISYRKAKLRTDEKKINLKLICDTCSLEVFINDGIMTFTNTFFFKSTKSNFIIENGTTEKLHYDFWKIQKMN